MAEILKREVDEKREADNKREVDVLVVGGATTGLYFGGLMARQGKRVLICDSASEDELGAVFDIIHIAKEHFERFGIKEPAPGDEAYVSSFTRSIQRSALNNWPKNSYGNTLVLRRVPLIKSLLAWALEQGAELLFETHFEQPVFNDEGKLVGAKFSQGNGGELAGSRASQSNADEHADARLSQGNGGELADARFSQGSTDEPADARALQSNTDELIVEAKLIADASGIPAVVRTALPDGYGVENFVCTPRHQFYVILHYVDLANPERDHVDVTTTWTHYKIWLAPQHGSNGAIMGVGANLSFDYAERVYERFLTKGFMPPHTLEHLEQGSTPYCRIPYSLVADGLVVLGTAACISNPWSGEGVPYSWLQCQITAEVCERAMEKGAYPTKESLWPINVQYQKAQGALFAKNLAMLSGATDCTEQENDYEYEKGIIYENQDEDGNSTERGSMIGKLIKGLLTRKISLSTLRKLMAASSIGEKIEKHYLAYPRTPKGLADWSAEAEVLWSQAGSMASLAEADLAQMQSD